MKRAGLSVNELKTGFSTAFTSAVNDSDALVKALDKLGIRSVETGKALAGSLDKALTAATTEKAVKAVIERLEELGKKGQISGKELADGLEKARAKIDTLLPGIQSLNEALGTFGLKSRDELVKTAETMKESYAKISGSIKVSLADKTAAFEQYSKAAIAANGGVESSEITLQREMLRIKTSAETAGDSIVDNMGRAGGAIENVVNKAREAQNELDKIERKRIADNTIVPQTREDKLRGQAATDATGADALEAKRRNGTLSAADLPLAQALADAARTNELTRFNNVGAFGIAGNQSITAEQARAATLLDAVQGIVRQQGGTQGQQGTQQASPSRTININIGGRNTPVNVSSEADAKALASVLRQLESASQVAGR